MSRRAVIPAAVALAASLGSAPALPAEPQRAMQAEIGFDQRIGAVLPSDLTFRDRQGESVRFGELVGDRPAILVVSWYSCANICPVIFRNLGRSIRETEFRPGEDYRLIAVSVDPGDGPAEAQGALDNLAAGGNEPVAHMLTGRQRDIARLADAVGFSFVHDTERDTYGHPAGAVVLEGRGRVNRYLIGLEFPPEDLELALLAAGRGELGSVVDQLVLRCFTFDPETGRYSLAVASLLRTAGLGSAILLGAVLMLFLIRERRSRRRRGDAR